MKGSSEVITQLNEILKGEVSAVNQYFLHASMIAHRPSGWGTALAEARRLPHMIMIMWGRRRPPRVRCQSTGLRHRSRPTSDERGGFPCTNISS
jgi:hypothetical protein